MKPPKAWDIKMMQAKDMFTRDAVAGYLARDDRSHNPYLFSSDCWLVWEAGYQLAYVGCSKPVKAKKSRGYSVTLWTQANKFTVKFEGDGLDKVNISRA